MKLEDGIQSERTHTEANFESKKCFELSPLSYPVNMDEEEKDLRGVTGNSWLK